MNNPGSSRAGPDSPNRLGQPSNSFPDLNFLHSRVPEQQSRPCGPFQEIGRDAVNANILSGGSRNESLFGSSSPQPEHEVRARTIPSYRYPTAEMLIDRSQKRSPAHSVRTSCTTKV